MENNQKSAGTTAKYVKYGIIAAIVIAVAIIGVFAIGGRNVSADQAISEVSAEAASGADLRIAVVRMDAIQTEAKALQDLRKQKENYENKLRDELTKQQKALKKLKSKNPKMFYLVKLCNVVLLITKARYRNCNVI